MKLYLLRHGEAAPSDDYDRDDDRPLTEDGCQQIEQVLAKLKKQNVTFDVIFASPYLRAFQSAELIAKGLNLTDKLFTDNLLAPGMDFGNLMELIDHYTDCQSILCVGHEPDLGIIAGELLLEDEPRPFKKAELFEVEI